MLLKFNFSETRVVATPMDSNAQFQLANEVLTMRDMIFIYLEMVGSIMFLVLGTHSDL
jgi:hypothetical protein